MTDPLGDTTANYLDFHELVDGISPAFSWYYDGTNLFFRLVLMGDPIAWSNKGVSKVEVSPFGWNMFIESTGDNWPDYVVSIDGTGSADTIHTMYNLAADDTMDAETGHSESSSTITPHYGTDASDLNYVYVLDDHARSTWVTSAGATTQPSYGGTFPSGGRDYLEFWVPLSWFSTSGGNPPAITATTPIKIAAGTGASGETIKKDLVCPTSNSTYSTTCVGAIAIDKYYQDVAAPEAPADGATGVTGTLTDTRSDSATNSGTWKSGETVRVSGAGWPPDSSGFYNSGNLAVRIQDSGSTTVWSGNVTTDASGNVSSASTWTVTGAGGVYSIQVADPRDSTTYATKDTFTVAESAVLSTSTFTVDKSIAGRRDTLTYTATVTNSGGLSSSPTLKVTLPTGVTYVAGSTKVGGASVADSSGTTVLASPYSLDAIAGGSSVTVTLQVTVNTDVSEATALAATADIADSANSLSVTKNAVTTAHLPDLATNTTFTVSSAAAERGDTLTYTVTIVNSGEVASSPTLQVTLPAGVTYVAGSTSVGGSTVADGVGGTTALATAYSLGSIAADGSLTATLQATVDTADTDAQSFSATAAIVDSLNGISLSKSAATTVQVPVVSISSAADNSAPVPGDDVNFTTTVTNDGHAAALDVLVKDSLPQNVDYLPGHVVVTGPGGASITFVHASDGDCSTADADETVPIYAICWGGSGFDLAALGGSASLTYRVQVR